MWAASTIALSLIAFAASTQVTPVEKVITLLEGLKKEVEAEGKSEAKLYDKFACFCKDMTAKKAKSITTGGDEIDKLSANIAQKTATKASEETKLLELQGVKEELSKDLTDNTVRCAKEKAEYEANAADLNKAISSLKNALKAMDDKKKALDAVSAASLLEIGGGIHETLDIAEAMGLIAAPKQKTISAFLQQGSAVDPKDPDYKYHSSDIVDLLTSLETDFKKEKATLDTEWGKAEKSCTDLKASLSKKLGTNSDETTSTQGKINKLGTAIADDRGDLVEAQDLMKDDEDYMKDLTTRCEDRANDWDQRSQMRSDEVTAITAALKIITNKVKSADTEVNKRAMLQEPEKATAPVQKTQTASQPVVKKQSVPATKTQNKPAAQPVVAKQAAKTAAKSNAVTSFLQRAAVNAHEYDLNAEESKLLQEQAVTTIRDEGLRLGSPVLTALAMRVAADPFKKVKGLIQGLIERLIKEAAQEATKKGFCDTEMGKAEKDRDFRYTEVKKTGAEIAVLEAKEDQLTNDIDTLTKEIDALNKAMKDEAETRKTEKAANQKTLEKAKEGYEAVNEALKVLRAFYRGAAKAAAFVQASPVDDDTAGAGFSGSYKGKQEGSNAILDLLETISADFDRTVRKTEDAEKEAARDYVEATRASKTSVAGKSTKKELNEQDLKTTKNTLDKKTADMKTNMDLVDDAVKTLMELKPSCIDTGMSYKDRVAKREEEIAALKKGLCILDPNKVEPDCK